MAKTAKRSGSRDDVVANPVRLAIIRALRDHGELTLDELADAADVHRNTIRAHCGALDAAGTIDRAPPAPGPKPGRPMVRYRLAAAHEPEGMSRLLGAALGDRGISYRQARRLGHRQSDAFAPSLPKRLALKALQGHLADLGFRADVGSDRIELTGCPCPVLSPDDPALVCALVTGAIDGALEASGAPEQVVDGEHNPSVRRCCLRLSSK